MKLIVGLGNPGKQYTKTRHNVGFMVLDELRNKLSGYYQADKWNLSKKFNAELSGCTIAGKKIVLAKPMTFMNASGQSVQLIANFYKIPVEDLIVIHDEKDIPLGEIKIQQDRGPAGHNGIKSIIEHTGSKNFLRVRVGIASKNEKKMQDTSQFVLGKFGMFEKKLLAQAITSATDELIRMLKPL
ncbi:aminoacyl-tRNA hydrolase [Candidatus Nomurabacteria bacterium]|nr:aminoacyl-tRNA hydrolase [Candidatus Nomurabacteria bacterium]